MVTPLDNWQALFADKRRHTLKINDSRLQPDILRFHGREALSEPFSWHIEFTTTQRDITGDDALLKFATLTLGSGRVVEGIITSFAFLKKSADQCHFALTLSSRLALLDHTRRCAVWQNISVPQLVEQLLRHHGLTGADFAFQLTGDYPGRELITQWRESDLQFIRRITAEVGIWFRTGVNTTTGLDTVTFADSAQHYQFHVHLPYCEPSALYDGAEESLWEARVWQHPVSGRVTVDDYNYRTATTPMTAQAQMRSAAVTAGEQVCYATMPYYDAGDDTAPQVATESGAFYARLHHERALNQAVRLHLFSNAGHLTPGMVLEADGSDLAALQEGMVITLATFRGARDSRLHVSLWGMPYCESFCYRPPVPPRPRIAGTLPARVESDEENDRYAHLDSSGRYRVRLDFSREEGEPGYHYLWLRQARPYAGEAYGWHTPLIAGTEVAIAFEGGDPDRPCIAGAFHDSEHQDVVTRDNRSQNILRTAGHNELRMEDRRQQQHTALSTPFGATALNQGHIVDSHRQVRGTGFELRTDEYGVIRVAKGLLITAEGQSKGEGEVLSQQEALREIAAVRAQLQGLAGAARQVHALEADIASQEAMAESRLQPVEGVIHCAAPQGVALTSGEHLQLSAGKNIAINAGGDISAGAGGDISMQAGDRVGVFGQKGKVSLISGNGPLQFQAQNGQIHLGAEQRLRLVSATEMLLAGKKRLRLVGGGSSLILEEGQIKYETEQTYTCFTRRLAKQERRGHKVDMPMLSPVLENKICIPCLLKAIKANDAVIQGA